MQNMTQDQREKLDLDLIQLKAQTAKLDAELAQLFSLTGTVLFLAPALYQFLKLLGF